MEKNRRALGRFFCSLARSTRLLSVELEQPQALNLEAIYRQHRRFLCRVAIHLGVPYADAQDVVHNAFLSIHRALSAGGTPPAKPIPWLYSVIRHHASDFIERACALRRKVEAIRAEPFAADAPIAPLDVEERVLDDDERRFFEDALERMAPERRAVWSTASCTV